MDYQINMDNLKFVTNWNKSEKSYIT